MPVARREAKVTRPRRRPPAITPLRHPLPAVRRPRRKPGEKAAARMKKRRIDQEICVSTPCSGSGLAAANEGVRRRFS
jgi:hypothetical protein